jgi:hypothetical protein
LFPVWKKEREKKKKKKKTCVVLPSHKCVDKLRPNQENRVLKLKNRGLDTKGKEKERKKKRRKKELTDKILLPVVLFTIQSLQLIACGVSPGGRRNWKASEILSKLKRVFVFPSKMFFCKVGTSKLLSTRRKTERVMSSKESKIWSKWGRRKKSKNLSL